MPKKKNYIIKLFIVLCIYFVVDKAISHAILSYNAYLPYIRRAYPPPTATRTPIPTSTATPQPTNTPIFAADCPPVPTPTPGGLPEEYVSIENISAYVTDNNGLHVAGEIANHTAGYIGQAWLNVNLFSADMRLLDREYTYTHQDHLDPSKATCFKAFFDAIPNESCYVGISGSYLEDVGPPPALFLVPTHTIHYSSGEWWSKGFVKNSQGSYVEWVKAIGAIRESGRVVGCEFDYVDGIHLAADDQGDFEMWFTDRPYSYDTTRVEYSPSGEFPTMQLAKSGVEKRLEPIHFQIPRFNQ